MQPDSTHGCEPSSTGLPVMYGLWLRNTRFAEHLFRSRGPLRLLPAAMIEYRAALRAARSAA